MEPICIGGWGEGREGGWGKKFLGPRVFEGWVIGLKIGRYYYINKNTTKIKIMLWYDYLCTQQVILYNLCQIIVDFCSWITHSSFLLLLFLAAVSPLGLGWGGDESIRKVPSLPSSSSAQPQNFPSGEVLEWRMMPAADTQANTYTP